MNIPNFQTNGELPLGIHEATLAEIEERFGHNSHRLALIQNLKRALSNLRQAGVRRIYIDGSFVTNKAYPADIDGCWDAHADIDTDILDPVFLDFNSGRQAMRERYDVDFFISQVIEGISGKPFIDFFQIDRDGNPKGILALTL
jgi:hypothetical protein